MPTSLFPHLIPATPLEVAPPTTPSADPFSSFDVAIGGIQFAYSNNANQPMIRETVPTEKQRFDSALTPGENTLSQWWIKSQDSFHGGAGQLYLEPAVPQPTDHTRFDLSKNVDVFTPGRVMPLPDTTVISSDNVIQVVSCVLSGADAVVYLTSAGAVKLISTPTGTPSLATFSASGVSSIKSICSDGANIYACNTTDLYRLDPASTGTATKIAILAATATTGPVVSWQKAHLMLGVNGSIYEVDPNPASPPVTLSATQLRYTHPSKGFTWRCFGASPGAILAAGDAGGQSTITEITVQSVSGAPTLVVQGDIATLPIGEQVLSLQASQGSFLAIGTSKGVRIATYNTYTGKITYGPLELLPTDPVIPAVSLAQRDRFIYVAGKDYDEGGLIAVDLGTQVDQAGRFAWSPHLISPAFTATAATSVTTLPVSNLLVFSVPGTGVLVEGIGPGSVRTPWLRTSRIRYSTVEPKLFKLGRVRGEFDSGTISVVGATPFNTQNLITIGFTETDPDDFRLNPELASWLALTFSIHGATSVLNSYQVEALPGARRQRHIELILTLADNETTRSGQRVRDAMSSREKLAALEELDAKGDEVILQEFTQTGVVSTVVVIEQLTFKQYGRPTRTSDMGGDVIVLLRTVES